MIIEASTITVARPTAMPRKIRIGRYSRSKLSIARTPYDKPAANARAGQLCEASIPVKMAPAHADDISSRAPKMKAWNASRVQRRPGSRHDAQILRTEMAGGTGRARWEGGTDTVPSWGWQGTNPGPRALIGMRGRAIDLVGDDGIEPPTFSV